MAAVTKYLADRKDAIVATATVVGVVVAAGGFFATYVQLQRTTHALQASNTYAVQKDARDIVERLNGNKSFVEALDGGYSPAESENFLSNLWIMLNFYLSVFRQSQVDGLSPEFVVAFSHDFCDGFIKRKGAAEGWEDLTKQHRIGMRHLEMRRQWCGDD